MHIDVPQNMTGRDFVVGDVHGCFDLLQQSLKDAGFNAAQDRLFSVGDIIDRGPDSAKCLELLDLPWFFMVRGNHEQMMIDAVLDGRGYDWATYYGDWTSEFSRAELQQLASRISELPVSMTLDCGEFKAGICHAEPPGNDWENIHKDEASAQMLWGRKTLRDRRKILVENIDITVHGHTPLELPAWVGNRYFMDTGAWNTDILTLRKITDIWADYTAAKNVFSRGNT